MKCETIWLNKEKEVSLTVYIQPAAGEFRNIKKRPMVLVIPGGAYVMCSDREADPVALVYSQAGFQTAVLRYSVGEKAAWPQPLLDYEQAMQYIEEHAEDWEVDTDRIAVIGFSAGGHLAGCAATMAKHRPAAAILGYSLLKGEDVQQFLSSAPDVVSAVDETTPPSFLFATASDDVVPVANTIAYSQAMARHGRPFECHIYSFGPHGFSTADTSVQYGMPISERCAHWPSDSVAWLREVWGDFGPEGFTENHIKEMEGKAR